MKMITIKIKLTGMLPLANGRKIFFYFSRFASDKVLYGDIRESKYMNFTTSGKK